jgi:hypothetical protein
MSYVKEKMEIAISIAAKPLVMLLGFLILALAPMKASAGMIEICFDSGDCFVVEGSCDGWCPNAPFAPTCTTQAAFKPTLDYFVWNKLTTTALLVTPKETFKVGSDKLVQFIGKIKAKYGKAAAGDKKLQQRISAEYKAFRKTDDGIVSAARLARLAKETGLKIRQSDKKKDG